MKHIRLFLSRKGVDKAHSVKNGFTLLELLVVIGIISVLISITAISYSSINKRSRDARRKSDLEQVRSAMEMYRADFGYYPTGPNNEFKTFDNAVNYRDAIAGYMTAFPKDPKDDTEYPYQIMMTDRRSDSNFYGYCLAAYTEAPGSSVNTCGVGVNLPKSPTLDEPYTYGVKNP